MSLCALSRRRLDSISKLSSRFVGDRWSKEDGIPIKDLEQQATNMA
jgi:hypothetical protein